MEKVDEERETSGRLRPLPGRRTRRWLGFLLCLLLGAELIPRWLCGSQADSYFDSDTTTVARLGRQVAGGILRHPGRLFYTTGNLRMDGQSAVAIYQMTLLGLGQIVLDHPELRGEFLPAMQEAADRLADPQTLAYASRVYGQHGTRQMDPGEGHAYLGYINLGLGMLRRIDPDMKQAELHDRLTEALARRIRQSPNGLIETYPGETWPPDVAAVAGSIGLHGQATGKDWSPMLRTWSERFANCAVDPSGYLVQRIRSGSCKAVDVPRGSGTAVAAYFLSFADRTLSSRLHQALREHGIQTFLGFGGIAETPVRDSATWDSNAGPVVFGVSVGATGFGLGSARAHADRAMFQQLFRTASLFGVPTTHSSSSEFLVGGMLGNALLLAMLTARSA